MMTGEAKATKLAREVAASLKMFGRGYLKDRGDRIADGVVKSMSGGSDVIEVRSGPKKRSKVVALEKKV